ncbi:hypothetical protein [Devosia aurantiaca]|uniref:Uncharacterized protein n=1 Tax=Devosia aurantiaca TaxID=2714858 RepID=A0A6M1SBS8_9HYPH|nr:hypothetical protein [Devosia aurantiaca]NGP17207.1 hypothetical protein [Devosia aurantiaca]
MSEQQEIGSNQVFRVLTEVGRRSKKARFLPLLVFTLAIGIAALGGAIVLLGPEWPSAAWLIAGLTLACLAMLTLNVLGRQTRTGVVARRVDHALGLSEQLSSAIYVANRGLDTAVTRSLLHKAGDAANSIDIVRAIPMQTRLLGISVAALLVALSGTALAYGLLNAAPQPITAAAEPAETPAQNAIAAEDLDVLAKLIANDAERRNSDYLEALANSIEALAEKARDGASQAEIETQLQALMEHAAAGYAGDNPEWLDQGQNAGAVLQNAVAFNTARQQAAEQRARLAERNGEGSRISSADMYRLDDDRMARSATPTPQGNSPPSDNAVSDREGTLENASLGGGESLAKPMEDEAFTSAGSLPVGAAAQSGKGESNIAGGGSQALAENSAFLETMADPTQTMSIAADEVSEGSRIRMHVPTSAELSATEAVTDGGAVWDRQLAQVVRRQRIAPSASPVVSHYFNRPAAEPER